MLLLMSTKAAIRTVLMQDNALKHVGSAVRPVPVNDEADDGLGNAPTNTHAIVRLFASAWMRALLVLYLDYLDCSVCEFKSCTSLQACIAAINSQLSHCGVVLSMQW